MKFSIKTEELQEMVGRAIQCVTNNKLIPLTSLMSIAIKDNTLVLTTTDATNFYYAYSRSDITCEDFEVSVLADLFTKLVQKTTSEMITIEVEGEILKVEGNGTYTFELPLDEGGVIKFPKKLSDTSVREDFGSIGLTKIKEAISINKASLATGMEYPILTTYYCGECVATSDRKKICRNASKMFDKPILISSVVMELLNTVSSENISVYEADRAMIFEAETETIYAPITDNVSEYPISAIENFISGEFTSKCKVSRVDLLNVIDRLALFVDAYDKKGIHLTFDTEGILLSSKKSSGKELIKFIESENFKPYTCCIDIEMLRSQLASLVSEQIYLYYGSEIAIKLEDKNITQIVALLDEGGN